MILTSIRTTGDILKRAKYSFAVIANQVLLTVLDFLRRHGGTLLPMPPVRGIWNSTCLFAATPAAHGIVACRPVSIPCSEIAYRPAKSIPSSTHSSFVSLTHGPFQKSFVASLPNSRIIGQRGFIIASNGFLPSDISYEIGRRPCEHSLLSKTWIREGDLIPHSVFCLSAWGAANYFHWLFDVLPKLALLDQTSAVPEFFASMQTQAFQTESLRALGLEKDRLIPLVNKSVFACSTVIATSAIERNGDIPQWVVAWLRKKFVAHPPATRKRRILVARTVRGRRAWANQDDALPLLESLGFEPAVLEKLSFDAQVALFSEAEAVLAPHGAGLANLAFAPIGCKVVELFAASYVNPCYYKLSAAAGLDYHYLVGKGASRTDTSRPAFYDDITVDLVDLRKTLEHAGLVEAAVNRPVSC